MPRVESAAAAGTGPPMIEIGDVSKSFGDRTVLDGIDLAVGRGSIFALLGPNGAGKTTLIGILTTLIRADGGTARVAGFDVDHEAPQVRRAITLTGQDTAVDDLLTGRENLVLMSRLFGLSRRAARRRAADLLAHVDLLDSADRQVRTYSGGMRRRLDLAISVIPRPHVIFLDEPTTGLDPASRRRVWQSIRDLASSGTTVFLTTQYLEEADQLADHIAILAGGRIVAEGSAGELKRRVGAELVRLAFADAAAASAATTRLTERGVPFDADGDATVTVRTGGGAAEVAVLLDHLGEFAGAAQLTVGAPSLDDAFFALTGTHHGADPSATVGQDSESEGKDAAG